MSSPSLYPALPASRASLARRTWRAVLKHGCAVAGGGPGGSSWGLTARSPGQASRERAGCWPGGSSPSCLASVMVCFNWLHQYETVPVPFYFPPGLCAHFHSLVGRYLKQRPIPGIDREPGPAVAITGAAPAGPVQINRGIRRHKLLGPQPPDDPGLRGDAAQLSPSRQPDSHRTTMAFSVSPSKSPMLPLTRTR